MRQTTYHKTFSLGALWRISKVLDVEFYKLCLDNEDTPKVKYIEYVCNKCGLENNMPIKVIEHFKKIYELADNKNLPYFDCINCDGILVPKNPMDL